MVEIYINDNRLELFDGENVELVKTLTDMQDISKTANEYSKTFDVPATPLNNKILQYFANAQVENDLIVSGASARIIVSGNEIASGTIKVQSAAVEDWKTSHYTIYFISGGASLKSELGSATLQDLTTLGSISFNSSEIADTFTVDYNSNNAIRSLIMNNKALFYNNTGVAGTEGNINIFNASIKIHEFNILVPVRSIISAISTYLGGASKLTVSPKIANSILQAFVTTAPVSEDFGVPRSSIPVEFEDVSGAFFSVENNVISFDNKPSSSGASIWFRLKIVIVDSSSAAGRVLLLDENRVVLSEHNFDLLMGFTEQVWSGDFSMAVGQKFTVEVVFSSEVKDFYITYEVFYEANDTLTLCDLTSKTMRETSQDIASIMHPMKLVDYVKSIVDMFRGVVIVQQGNYYITSVEEYYNTGNVINMTNYADGNVTVSATELGGAIEYKFKEAENMLGVQYEEGFGRGFGDAEFSINDDSNVVSSINLGFESLPLSIITGDNRTNYAILADELNGDINDTPKLCVISRNSKNTHLIVADTTGSTQQVTTILHPVLNQVFDAALLFSSEYEPHSGEYTTRNLITDYHQNYLSLIGNKTKRQYKVTFVDVPLAILTSIATDDIIRVGDGFYRINSMTISITERKITAELYNI